MRATQNIAVEFSRKTIPFRLAIRHLLFSNALLLSTRKIRVSVSCKGEELQPAEIKEKHLFTLNGVINNNEKVREKSFKNPIILFPV